MVDGFFFLLVLLSPKSTTVIRWYLLSTFDFENSFQIFGFLGLLLFSSEFIRVVIFLIGSRFLFWDGVLGRGSWRVGVCDTGGAWGGGPLGGGVVGGGGFDFGGLWSVGGRLCLSFLGLVKCGLAWVGGGGCTSGWLCA